MEVETVDRTTEPAPPLETKSGIPVRERVPKGAERTHKARPTRLETAYADAKTQHSETATAVTEPPAKPSEVAPAASHATPSQPTATEPNATIPAQDLTFLSDEELSAVQAEHGHDPAALKKALDTRFNKALTPRLQKLARMTKAIEPYADDLDGLESDDPALRRQALQNLARKSHIALDAPPPAVESRGVEQYIADTLARGKKHVGPELEFLIDKLAPWIREEAEIASGRSVEGIRSQHEELLAESVKGDVSRSMQAFEAKHPDWKEHEDRMTELGALYPPAGTVSEFDWMESLYKLATYDLAIAKGTDQAIQRMTKGAKTSETSRPAIRESNVRPTMPRNPKWSDIVAASKRGEVWE